MRLRRWSGHLRVVLALVAALAAWYTPVATLAGYVPYQRLTTINRSNIATALARTIQDGEFPEEVDVRTWAGPRRAKVTYALDPQLQNFVEQLFNTYRPDYGAFVALDAATGRILSIVSYTRYNASLGNLTLKAWFPAASVFKVVTATAAIERENYTPDSIIEFTGGNHTLYKRNLTADPSRWSRKMTLREAFAKSVNTVFGKLGAFVLKPAELEEYARRFQFNQPLRTDLPVQRGHFELPDQDPFAIAEIASGFNRTSLMSPLQGAMIASAVANDGVMMAPYIVDNLIAVYEGEIIYRVEPRRLTVTMTPETAEQVRELMRETVRGGTARKGFRTLFHKPVATDLEIGGKTGSLTGDLPRGKCDWFVGYGRRGDRRLAIAALTVNERVSRVKASFLARSYIEHYFQELVDKNVADDEEEETRPAGAPAAAGTPAPGGTPTAVPPTPTVTPEVTPTPVAERPS